MRNTWHNNRRSSAPSEHRRATFADAAADVAIDRANDVMPAVLTALGTRNFSLASTYTYHSGLSERSVEADVSVPRYGNPDGSSSRVRLGWDERSVTHTDGTIHTAGVMTVHTYGLWGRVSRQPALVLDVIVSAEPDRERVAIVTDRPDSNATRSLADSLSWLRSE
jgi:hypothetical protein